MTISTLTQKIEITDVGSLTVTDVTQDSDTHKYIREIRVFDSDGQSLFTMRCSGDEAANVQLQAPTQTF